jgi:hypothetical protein
MGRSTEDADATRADEKTNDDQDYSPEHLPTEEGEDAGDDENDGEDPKQRMHVFKVPVPPPSQTT